MPDSVHFREAVAQDYPDYLRDESRRTGRADSISFPVTEEDLRRDLRDAAQRGLAVTVQGARTGIVAGAVPEGGHILNLSRMNRILGVRRAADGSFVLAVQPGVLLSEIRDALSRKEIPDAAADDPVAADFRKAPEHFFPTDPTETSASAGGMIACNASGARSFLYGSVRRHVERLRVILADGSALDLRRGSPKAAGRAFELQTDSGRTIQGPLPLYRMPAVKNAAGYFAEDHMDLLDLFIGSEGTLGVVSEIELRLLPLPAALCGVMIFFPAEEASLRFVRAVRTAPARPAAIEFFDSRALNLLREQKRENPAFGWIPDMPPAWHTAIYVECLGSDEAVAEAVEGMCAFIAACGADEDATWMAGDEREMKRLKDFRHAIPEAVNLLIDRRRKQEPQLTKLGTDLAAPDDALETVMALYHADLESARLEYVAFGHIGDNHVHVNILPNTMDEYRRGRELYLGWAKRVVGMGGTVSAEHGIGKLKTALLRELYGDEGIRQMREVKRLLDPTGMLNPGNLF